MLLMKGSSSERTYTYSGPEIEPLELGKTDKHINLDFYAPVNVNHGPPTPGT